MASINDYGTPGEPLNAPSLNVWAEAVAAALDGRVAACAAQQGSTEPEHWAYVNAYIWAASPGWAAAWDSAVASGVAEPGKDPAVIQDSMILSQVQGMLAT